MVACLHVAYLRKMTPADRSSDWGPWAAAHFLTESGRDGFLESVARTEDSGWLAEATPRDGRGAQVRWLPGRFLRLNDLAYQHGGRITVNIEPHWA